MPALLSFFHARAHHRLGVVATALALSATGCGRGVTADPHTAGSEGPGELEGNEATVALLQNATPPAPPSPESVSKKFPGGDADDPHFAALTRQLEASWGWRGDKDAQARFPLPDRRKWTRIRLFGVDHLTGFKYGKKEHAVSAVFLVELKEEDPDTSAACVQRFEEAAFPKVRDLGGHVTPPKSHMREWKKRRIPLVVRRASADVDILFQHYEVALAWTAYPAYDRTCLAYAVAVPWKGHRKLAEEVRDKWSDGFERFVPLTKDVPYRH